MKIDIYYSYTCGLCARALEFFRSRNLDFTAHAVKWDAEADAFVDSVNVRAMHERCGKKVDFVPQMFIGDVHIPGWRKLEPMIESGEIEAILPPQ